MRYGDIDAVRPVRKLRGRMTEEMAECFKIWLRETKEYDKMIYYSWKSMVWMY